MPKLLFDKHVALRFSILQRRPFKVNVRWQSSNNSMIICKHFASNCLSLAYRCVFESSKRKKCCKNGFKRIVRGTIYLLNDQFWYFLKSYVCYWFHSFHWNYVFSFFFESRLKWMPFFGKNQRITFYKWLN